MLNVQVAKPLIANVLLFFQVAFHLFTDLNPDKLEDNSHTRVVVEPVLELVYRVYTDEQYADSRAKELAFELVDYLSNGLDKTFFINTYNAVKANITRKRLERKKLQKVAMAGASGARIKERKPQKEDQPSSEEEEEENLDVKNPEMKSFLKNIDLMEDDAA